MANGRLYKLHEDFIERSQRNMEFGKLPIDSLSPELPIVPMERWREHEGALHKVYMFREQEHRNLFVNSLLEYELRTHHVATLIVKYNEVNVSTQTQNIERVTDIDKEYAAYCDVLYKDIVRRPRIVGSSSDETSFNS